MELANNPERAVDTETGDIYVWNYDVNEWIKEETVSNETDVPADTNNDKLLLQSDSVQALETKVTGLEQDVDTLSMEVAALSAAVSDYNLGTSNLTIFQGLVEKLPYGTHYVYWRESEYKYCLAFGESIENGIPTNTFTSSDMVTIVSYERAYSSGSQYSWTIDFDFNFSLDCGNRLVYSDLGLYPDIPGKGVNRFDAITAYCAVGVVLFALFDRLRRSCFGRK